MIDISRSKAVLTYPLLEIPNYPNYKITEFGEVVSYTRRIKRKDGMRGSETKIYNLPQYLLEPHTNTDDYYDLTIRNNRGKKLRLAHQLVLEAHGYPKPFPHAVTRHLDGNKKNNHISNLAWGTVAENAADLVRHQTLAGCNNPISKFNEAQIRFIRSNKKTIGQTKLAKMFGVFGSVIWRINSFKSYKNVK